MISKRRTILPSGSIPPPASPPFTPFPVSCGTEGGDVGSAVGELCIEGVGMTVGGEVSPDFLEIFLIDFLETSAVLEWKF